MREATRAFCRVVDSAATWAGKGVAWLVPILILALTYDTFMRYVFSNPTVWSFDVSYLLGGTIMLMGMGWVTVRREQVRVDVFYSKYSPRAKMAVDAVLNVFLFLPLYSVLFVQHAIPRAIFSFTNQEFSELGYWRPLLWPYRWMMVVALGLWLLATLVWIIRDVHKLKTGEDL